MHSKRIAALLASALAICAVCLGSGPSPAAAESGTVVGDGTAASCTQSALRAAVEAGGDVTFSCGSGAVTIPVTQAISVTNTAVLDGGNGNVTLDGEGANRILVAQNGTTLTVRGLAFVHGAAAQSHDRGVGSGGAIAGMTNTHVQVIDSAFRNNSAGYGGGAVAVATGSTLTITGSTFTGNSSWEGGAVYSLLSALTITGSTFTDNSTTTSGGYGDGGAIATDGASPTNSGGGTILLNGDVIAHNTGHGNGGGAYLYAYAPDRIVVQDTTFEDNTAASNGHDNGGDGGAARMSIGTYLAANGSEPESGDSVSVSGSSMIANTSDGLGGAFYLECNPTCGITDSTFYGNSAADYGGAVFGGGHDDDNVTYADNSAGSQGGALFGSSYVLDNTVFTGNSAHNAWGLAMSCGATGSGAHVLQWLAIAPDNSTPCVSGAVKKNPLLADPAANGGPTLTMMPAANSPVLNAGSGCEPKDQRGVSRATGGCDLGAVQFAADTAAASPAQTARSTSASASASARLSATAAKSKSTGMSTTVVHASDTGDSSSIPASLLPVTLFGAMMIALAALFGWRRTRRSRARTHRAAHSGGSPDNDRAGAHTRARH